MTIGKIGAPSAGAKHFVLDGKHKQYDAYIDIVEYFTGQWGIDCRYREIGTSGKWVWLLAPQIIENQLGNESSADEALSQAIKLINEEIKTVFGGEVKPIPESGIERLEWIVTNGLKVENNVISIAVNG
tara:strand:- start:1905 stop:2291 length:387 start_codon:yes stop_codon:yes gene_type:complete